VAPALALDQLQVQRQRVETLLTSIVELAFQVEEGGPLQVGDGDQGAGLLHPLHRQPGALDIDQVLQPRLVEVDGKVEAGGHSSACCRVARSLS